MCGIEPSFFNGTTVSGTVKSRNLSSPVPAAKSRPKLALGGKLDMTSERSGSQCQRGCCCKRAAEGTAACCCLSLSIIRQYYRI